MNDVRLARPEDAAALAVVHVEAWRAAYRSILPDRVLDGLSVAEFEDIWLGLLADSTRANLVICPAGSEVPAGFVAFRAPAAGDAEIIGLYVDPRHWREGMGRQLIEAALARLEPRSGRIVLWVMRGNARARAFYESAGFRASGARRESERYGVKFEELEYEKAAGAQGGRS